MKETVKSWKFGLTTVQWRKDDLQDRLRKSREIVAGVLEPDREPSGEEGILLMKALTGMDRVISNVNLPNAGQIPNLPMGAVVETNAVFAKDSVRPVMAGALPEEIRKLVQPHTENHLRTLKAAETLAGMIKTENPDADITIMGESPIIGAHTGPGTILITFWGDRSKLK